LNTQIEFVEQSIAFFAPYNEHLTERCFGHDIDLVYSKDDWQQKPVVELGGEFGDAKVYCAGWFIYNNQRNDLKTLAQDYVLHGQKVFDEITLGVFVFVHVDESDVTVICDAYGLSTHYLRSNRNKLEVAPSVKAFADPGKANPQLAEMLNSLGHLVGNYTVYDDISRIDPGSVVHGNGNIAHYYVINFNVAEKDQLHKIPQYFKTVVDCWPKNNRTLPISGGLDSRLILTTSEFDYGFTYGPENSGDRPVARQYADCFNRYEEFEFTAPGLSDQEKPVQDEMFFGVSGWYGRLLSTYQYTRDKAKNAYVLFDGYAGDPLQRGNGIKFSGPKGLLLKLFPWCYRIDFSARFIFRNRYKTLSEATFELLMADFEKRTRDLQATTYQKITYYEIVYGRGGRYSINGGLTAGQMYTMVPIFLTKPVLEMFLSQDFVDTAQFKLVSKIWRDVPLRFSQAASEAGVGPMTPYWITPFKNLFHRFLAHYIPGFGTYDVGRQKK
ncbi:MAG: hypothetical protein MJK04_07870, partial [Psychrosphaera sp.]|nr:hypothetical protein [Psychrosphaera sp.]